MSSQGDEDVILNQQGAPPPFPEPPPFRRGAGATSSSQQHNLDPSIFFDAFSNFCQQHLAQQTTQTTTLRVDRETIREVRFYIGADDQRTRPT